MTNHKQYPLAPSYMAMVKEFHQASGQPIEKWPTIPHVEVTDLREDLIREEFQEFVTASNRIAIGIVQHQHNNMVELADALADMVYVICGTALTYGIDLDKVFAEVHRSNMTKFPATYDDKGKVQKGPNYVPPDIKGVLGL